MEMKVVFILVMRQKQGDHAEKVCFLSTSHLGCATLPQLQAKGRAKPSVKPNSLVTLGLQTGYVQYADPAILPPVAPVSPLSHWF